MGNGEKRLGRLLLETLKGIDALIPAATPAQVEQLRLERGKLLEAIARLVDVNLDRADTQYRAAAAALASGAPDVTASAAPFGVTWSRPIPIRPRRRTGTTERAKLDAVAAIGSATPRPRRE